MILETSNIVWMWVAIVGLCFMSLMIGYSIGHKHGWSEGFLRGRSINYRKDGIKS